jgi:hypothetical protein
MVAIKDVFRFSVSIVCVGLLLSLCQQQAHAADNGAGGQSLEQAANDPTASLMNIQIQNIYTGDYHNLDDEHGNTVLLRSAIPFKIGEINNIARITLPVITNSPSNESGIGDLVLFDLVAIDESWGRWGFGPVMLLPTASEDELGAEKWAIGPALGFVASKPGLLWGLFNQNLITFAGDDNRDNVNVSLVQPILNYALPNKWSIGTSEMNLTYDWNENAWIALPLGAKLSKMVKLGSIPTQLSGSYEYNFQDDYIAPEWSVNFSVKLLFPI